MGNFQNEGVTGGQEGGRWGLKMAALHRPLSKESFHLRAQGEWASQSEKSGYAPANETDKTSFVSLNM